MPDLFYLPPAPGEILQGDIYEDMPSIFIDERPLLVARPWKKSGGRDIWAVHSEDGPPPAGGFTWRMDRGGEKAVHAHAHLGRAIVLTHDCEIENDQTVRTLAMIRPVSEFGASARDRLFSGREEDIQYALFPLEAQSEEPSLERCLVDFRRLTTVRPAVLDQSTRIASLSEELRSALAHRFKLYLFRRMERLPTGEK